jgi:secondary thiamine-phosphate synthase enzyme
MVDTQEIRLKTSGAGDVIDITQEIQGAVTRSRLKSGSVTVFVPGSTGGLTTLEYEPGLLQDLPNLMEKLVPSDRPYQHDETWHDGNGFSHLRSAMIGPDITVPFVSGKLLLGTWQQVVFLEFDNKPRSRRVILQLIGEG